jgi:hypothetical protein
LVRPDGSVKPHAQVLQKFAASNPTVQTTNLRTVSLPDGPDAYYRNPLRYLPDLYTEFVAD